MTEDEIREARVLSLATRKLIHNKLVEAMTAKLNLAIDVNNISLSLQQEAEAHGIMQVCIDLLTPLNYEETTNESI